MRFLEDGPDIPSELLRARDAGDVVVFCGAGVSRHRAGLPSFSQLAKDVLQSLGATENCDAYRVLDFANQAKSPGLIAVDRVFSFIERDFAPEFIRTAVANALRPTDNPDLSAHNILLRLATTAKGKQTRLVTTNFDRLFDQCRSNLTVHAPPRLPVPSREKGFEGLVYLHGRVNTDYTDAAGRELVLSSGDFGHAYLADGWATEFFLEIVRHYTVLFVGYSADDPPINYLLEGLRGRDGSNRAMYAFQSECTSQMMAHWRYRGVTAIPCAIHDALWASLEKWAEHADDPIAWHDRVIDDAVRGPKILRPFQRGQVAHIVSSRDGARLFAERAPPAEWLCVFDSCQRLRNARRTETAGPCQLYGLDSDPFRPDKDRSPATWGASETGEPWDAFKLTDEDRRMLVEGDVAGVYGQSAREMPQLSGRRAYLAAWIGRVAEQPFALWWAVQQEVLHRALRERIRFRLEQAADNFPNEVGTSWKRLLDSWERPSYSSQDWHVLKERLRLEGWSCDNVREFISLATPFIQPTLRNPGLPAESESAAEFVKSSVVISCPPSDLAPSDEVLLPILRGMRSHLELAVNYATQVNDLSLQWIRPLAAEAKLNEGWHHGNQGVDGLVRQFSSFFSRLVQTDPRGAKLEFESWPTDDSVFCRLRVWAAGAHCMIAPEELARVVRGMSDRVFWSPWDRPDLLLALAARWVELREASRSEIEARLLEGPAKWPRETEEDFLARKSSAILQRLAWLDQRGCQLSPTALRVIDELATRVPDWKPEFAAGAIARLGGRSGFVATETDASPLRDEPIRSILSKATELSGRDPNDRFIEHDPFKGLCIERPVRAYLALARAVRKHDYPVHFWEELLHSQSSKAEQLPRLSRAVAMRLCRMNDETIHALLHPAVYWFSDSDVARVGWSSKVFVETVRYFITVLQSPPHDPVAKDPNIRPERLMEALNSPGGLLAEAIIAASMPPTSPDAITAGLEHLDQLLTGPPPVSLHAITICGRVLSWLFDNAREWTKNRLLSWLDGSDENARDSLWAGFLHDPRTSKGLFARIKSLVLQLARSGSPVREENLESLSRLLCAFWRHESDEARVTDADFRLVLVEGGDELRSHVLWQFHRSLERSDEDDSAPRSLAIQFFKSVWPRQKVVINPLMSARLTELLFASRDGFSELLDVVHPFLTKISGGVRYHLHFLGEDWKIVTSFPERLLTLLYLILADDVFQWPYGIPDLFDRIVKADAGLATDPRMLELKHRWRLR